jgi:hypothetical protein
MGAIFVFEASKSSHQESALREGAVAKWFSPRSDCPTKKIPKPV